MHKDLRLLVLTAGILGVAWLLWIATSGQDPTQTPTPSRRPSVVPTPAAPAESVAEVLDRKPDADRSGDSSIQVMVVDEQQSPLSAASLLVSETNSRWLPAQAVAAAPQTGSDGELDLAIPQSVAPCLGSLSLYCIRTGYATAEIHNPQIGRRYRIVMAAGNAVSIQCLTVEGEPLAGVHCVMSRSSYVRDASEDAPAPGQGHVPGAGQAALFESRTGTDGMATFAGVPSGKYLLMACHDTHACIRLDSPDGNLDAQISVPCNAISATFAPMGVAIWKPGVSAALVANYATYAPKRAKLSFYLAESSTNQVRSRLQRMFPDFRVEVAVVANLPTVVSRKVFAPDIGFGTLSYPLTLLTDATPLVVRADASRRELPVLPGDLRVTFMDEALTSRCALIFLVSRDKEFRIPLSNNAIVSVPPGQWTVESQDFYVQTLLKTMPPIDVESGYTQEVTFSAAEPVSILDIRLESMGAGGVHADVNVLSYGKSVNRRSFVGKQLDLVVPATDLEVRLFATGYHTISKTLTVAAGPDKTIWLAKLE